jgi:hypothetical protein
MECFYPGRVLVGPGLEAGGSQNLTEHIKAELGADFQFEFGVDEILAHYELRIPEVMSKRGLPFVGRVPEGAETEIARRLAQFSRNRIAAATPDYLVRPSAPITIDQGALDQAIQNMGALPGGSQCGNGCVIGILDSGVDPNYVVGTASLYPRQYDALAPSSSGSALSDPTGHGSLVARIVNSVAPSAKLISVKTFDQYGTISSVIAGLYIAHAAGPCDILNLSLSVSCAPEPCAFCGTTPSATTNIDQLGYFFRNFMQEAPNCVLVAAAGNNISYVSLPAAFDQVIAVGSFDYRACSPISSYNDAPADRFVFAAGGQNAMGEAFATRSGFPLQYLHGTSFAAAFISGFAAKTVCNWKGVAPCGTPRLGQPASSFGSGLLATVLGEINARADKSWPGFDPVLHGLGAIRF